MSIQKELTATIADLIQPGKGILAADESTPTITKRFKAVGVESTEEKRREYRSIIFSTPELGKYISGVILYEETLEQLSLEDVAMPKLIASQDIVPGIKVDKGKGPLVNAPGDEITYGLDGLESRLEEYKKLGARFAKWRDVFHISDTLPSRQAIKANAEVLARYAAVCQSIGMVPIVEPEVLINGRHSIERAGEVSEAVLRDVFNALYRHHVDLETMVLKPSMVTPGKESASASPEQVAEHTLMIFRRAVPAAVPGIFFLSGGQAPAEATANLNAISSMGYHPWELSFSYGRALQEPALQAWSGDLANAEKARAALHKRAWLNGLARSGNYSPSMEVGD